MTGEDELNLLREQVKQIPLLLQTIESLQKQVKERQDRLGKDSHNSSLPPSSERFVRQRTPKSLRKKSGKKVGGQPGHPGQALELSEIPDQRQSARTCWGFLLRQRPWQRCKLVRPGLWNRSKPS